MRNARGSWPAVLAALLAGSQLAQSVVALPVPSARRLADAQRYFERAVESATAEDNRSPDWVLQRIADAQRSCRDKAGAVRTLRRATEVVASRIHEADRLV